MIFATKDNVVKLYYEEFFDIGALTNKVLKTNGESYGAGEEGSIFNLV
jgi:hypothetical protein